MKIDLVPCGKCPACRKNKINDWAFRVEQESSFSENAYFVTLTYNDENLPEYVNKEDIQKFFKRLRKICEPEKIGGLPNVKFHPLKYFLCSEYGSQFNRPHYHAVIMNVIPLDGTPQEAIEKAWQKGFVYLGSVTPASIRYVLKYMFKDAELSEDKKESLFYLMSKKLGEKFLNEHNKRNIGSRDITYIPQSTGKARMPRYISEKIYGDRRGLVFRKARRLYELNQGLELMSPTELQNHFIEERQKQIAYIDDERRRQFFQRLGLRYPR